MKIPRKKLWARRPKITYSVWCNEGKNGGYGFEGLKTDLAALRCAQKELKDPGYGVTSVSIQITAELVRIPVKEKK